MLSLLALTADEVAAAITDEQGPAGLRRRFGSEQPPDVVVLDAPAPSAPELTAAIVDALPEVAVLVVGPEPDATLGLACLRAGADGVLAEGEVRDGLWLAVQQLGHGRAVLGRSASDAVLDVLRRAPSSPTHLPLTPTQERILDLMTTGATNREIADRLGLSEKTIKNYATAIYATLGAANRTEAVAIWARLREVPA